MLSYEIVDVFTDTAFTGNPLAVVLDAQELPAASLQALAREFNLSETAFPMPSDRADYRLRIFTPDTELPFAGHPSIGAAHTLARLGRIGSGLVVQDCGAGLLPLTVGADSVTLTGGTPTLGEALDPEPLLRAVGLDASALVDGAADGPAPGALAPRLAGCGLEFGYLPVRPSAVGAVDVDLRLLSRVVPAGAGGVCVLAWDATAAQAHVRVFAASVGVAEDPATGSAALGLGCWLVSAGLLPGQGRSSYTVRQGAELHRPSQLHCEVTADRGAATEVTVRGSVVPVASGTIRRP